MTSALAMSTTPLTMVGPSDTPMKVLEKAGRVSLWLMAPGRSLTMCRAGEWSVGGEDAGRVGCAVFEVDQPGLAGELDGVKQGGPCLSAQPFCHLSGKLASITEVGVGVRLVDLAEHFGGRGEGGGQRALAEEHEGPKIVVEVSRRRVGI